MSSLLHGTERFAYSVRTRSAVESVLTEGLRIGPLDVRWIEDEDPDFELDRSLGIDCVIESNGLGTLTSQIKTHPSARGFHTVTIETQNGNGSLGDRHTCQAMLYSTVYCDDDFKPVRWAILDWSRLLLASLQRKLRWRHRVNGDGQAGAEFDWLPFSEILRDAPEAIISYGGDWEL